MNLRASLRHRQASGFTLIEIVLAIGITIGLLVVVLFFYQQSSQVRTQILEEVERASVIRLFLDQFARELQTAHNDDFLIMGLTGTSNYIEFVTSTLPGNSAWNARTMAPRSDLHLLRYRLDSDFDGGFVWLNRDEETLVETVLPLVTPDLTEDEPSPGTNSAPVSTVSIDAIRHLQLRYWNGTGWQDSWSAWELPAGVEITISHEQLPEDANLADHAESIYRRVVYLPQHQVVNLFGDDLAGSEGGLP